MPAFLENPRRSPRVRVDLAVDVSCDGELWRSFTCDFGPGGCSFVSQRPFANGAQVRTLVQGTKIRETLAVEGRVAWSGGGRVGVEFLTTGPTAEADRWFDLLLRARPELGAQVSKLPARVSEDERLVRCPPAAWRDVEITTNELLVLAHMDGTATVGALAARIQLSEGAFARAIFGLLEKHVVELHSPQLGN